jgi:putative ABC transport system permease protein
MNAEPATPVAERQARLPMRKAVRIAWKNIRVRWLRSLLVTSGIVLALAFLSFILCTEAQAAGLTVRGSGELLNRLRKEGLLTEGPDARARAQTWWMVGLALLVSFVGILNAMLMSVTERFREIGTMKCLGAMDALIVRLFLLESLFQGALGTSLGVALGLTLAGLQGLASYGAEAWRLVPPADLLRIVGLCFAAGISLTVVGALYPAWRAARMEPVDAMRSEV